MEQNKLYFLEEMLQVHVSLTWPVFEVYSALKVGNIQDFDNGKVFEKLVRMVLCHFLPSEIGNSFNFPVSAKGKILLANLLLLQFLFRLCRCKRK